MTEITTVPPPRYQATHRFLHIDMTPMVDLSFLLITFFIITASMVEDKALRLFMPADGAPGNIGESTVVTLLLGSNNQVYVYPGKWNDAVDQGKISATTYHVHTGAGAFIRACQALLGQQKTDLLLLIKPTHDATYQNVIAALDEAAINTVTRYAIVEPTEEEIEYATGY